MKYYTIDNGILTAVVSDKGGELVSLRTENGPELLWQGGDGFWDGVSPNLFPVCGRLTDGFFMHAGKKYSMPCHGFLKDTQLSLLVAEKNYVTLCADTSEPAYSRLREQFPYAFRLELTFRLCGNRILIEYKVTANDGPLYFSWGGHPGFRVPADGIGDFSDWMLEFDRDCRPLQIEITPNGFCGNRLIPFELRDFRVLPLKHSLFDVEGVFLRNTSGSVTLRRTPEKTFEGSPVINVSYPDCMTLGLWHDAGKPAPFICIEPWHGSPDTDGVPCLFPEKADIIALAPGEEYTGGYSIGIDRD